MKYDPERFGEGTRTGAAYAWTWGLAAQRDVEAPCQSGARWVPRDVVYLRDGVSPRVTDEEAVERYAAAFDDLPAITVQRGTFTLIDGRHRLEAAYRASSEVVRVREVDVADEDLAVEAFRANLAHGRPYTLDERLRGLKLLTEREPWKSMSSPMLSREVGLNRNTVERHRPQGGARVGADGRVTHVRGAQNEHLTQGQAGVPTPREPAALPSRVPKPAPKTFDPGREYDGGGYEDVDLETGEVVRMEALPGEDDRIDEVGNCVDGPYWFRLQLRAPCDGEGRALDTARLRGVADRAIRWIEETVAVYS